MQTEILSLYSDRKVDCNWALTALQALGLSFSRAIDLLWEIETAKLSAYVKQ